MHDPVAMHVMNSLCKTNGNGLQVSSHPLASNQDKKGKMNMLYAANTRTYEIRDKHAHKILPLGFATLCS